MKSEKHDTGGIVSQFSSLINVFVTFLLNGKKKVLNSR